MVSQSTQQFMYRAIILTVCLILGGTFLFMFGAALKLGDGEAVRIIDAMQTPTLSAFGSLVAFVLGHQVTQAIVAKAQVNAGQSTAPASDPTAAIPTANVSGV